jgi:hypothetical protein
MSIEACGHVIASSISGTLHTLSTCGDGNPWVETAAARLVPEIPDLKHSWVAINAIFELVRIVQRYQVAFIMN